MSLFQNQNSVNQFLTSTDGFEITLKREDQLHPYISGNKFRKLKYNLLQAQADGTQHPTDFWRSFFQSLNSHCSCRKDHGI